MLQKGLILLCIGFGCVNTTIAQQVTHSAWLASFNTIGLKGKWSLHLDVQLRSTNDVEQLQTFLFRPGLNFATRKNHVATMGYAWIPNRFVQLADNALLAEHRIWQQYIINQPIPSSAIQHRFRFEERFLPKPVIKNGNMESDGYAFNTRFRYFTRSVLPLKKPSGAFVKGWFGALQNEIFLNATGKDKVNGKVFDQNRLYGALGYRLAKGFDVELGYLWQYVERRNGLQDISNQVGQVAFYWRK
jgi:hypothetical protein